MCPLVHIDLLTEPVFCWLWAIPKELSLTGVSPYHLRSPGCLRPTLSTLRMRVEFAEVPVGLAPGSFGQGCRGLVNEAGKFKSYWDSYCVASE